MANIWTRAGAALRVMNLDEEGMRDLFNQIDVDKNGLVNERELHNAVRKGGMTIDSSWLKAMILGETLVS